MNQYFGNNLYLRHCLYFLLIFSLIACIPNKKISQGSVLAVTLLRNPANNEFVSTESYFPDTRFLFYGDYAVEEVKGILIKEDSNGHETRWLSQEPYIFTNRKKHSYYRFSGFSDTARILYQFTDADTIMFGVPWPFETKQYAVEIDKLETMADTLMSTVVYKRVRTKRKYLAGTDTAFENVTLYLQCSKLQPLLIWNQQIVDKYGCFLVRVDGEYMRMEIVTESRQLTPAQVKVIRAWIKKTKKYPGNPPDKRQGLDWPRALPE